MATLKDFEIVWDIIKNEKEIEDNYKHFREVKTFLSMHPDDPKSKIIKNLFIEEFNKVFCNEDLKSALNIDDNYKYYKTIEIYKNAPFTPSDSNMMNYFYDTIQHESDYFGAYYKFVKGAEWFLKSEGQCEVDDEVFDLLSKNAKENTWIYGPSKTEYDSYEVELKRLRDMSNGIKPDDYRSIKEGLEYDYRQRGINHWDENDIIRDYKAIKTGIVGEYDACKYILPLVGDFIAKDYGNGFGFDLFYYGMGNDGINKEILIEVKSTLNKSDAFILSDNEYEVLLDTIKRPNTGYAVARIYVDLDKDENYDRELMFYSKERNSFISKNNDNEIINEYVLDEKSNDHVFKRKKPKTKTLKNE